MIVFWTLIILIVYTYLLYPLFLKLFSWCYLEKEQFESCPDLKVDFVVLAYNEEKVIEAKILNSLNSLKEIKGAQLWIVSDGSTDKTNEIVSSYLENPILNFISLKRSGKSQSINSIFTLLNGDLVVFSDANVEYTDNTILNLLKPFNDNTIGCTCGKVVYRNPNKLISGEGESFYWKYENSLKKLESTIGYVAGATGAVYAIRKNLFKPLPSNCINDDFTISMKIVEMGYKSKYIEEAIVYENVAPSVKAEFKRHIRDATGHYISISHLIKLINPFVGLQSFIFWSHRLLRWAVPFFLIAIFILNIFLIDNINYLLLFYLQISFYFFALIGILFQKSKKVPLIFFIPFYFCNLNLALFLGFINSILYKQKGIWESTAR